MNHLNFDKEKIREESCKWLTLEKEIEKKVFGQSKIIRKILTGLLCNGHILLEGLPGLAKTTLVKTFAKCVGLNFSRIQFTPDLLPSDIVGTLIYNPVKQEFDTKKGPIFSNVILADEINRAPAKVQSALLEAMEEHQVTIGNQSFKLDYPFIVLATQNPIDQEGTYGLPEAQVDRFMLKLNLEYPSYEIEKNIISSKFENSSVSQVMNKESIKLAQDMVSTIFLDDKIIEYILNLVMTTRNRNHKNKLISNFIKYGASPRATIFMTYASKALAFLNGRDFVTPDDVKEVAQDILKHRIILSYEAEVDQISHNQIIKTILENVSTP